MSLAIKQGLVPKFGSHESFTIRYSWLKKGFDLVVEQAESGQEDGRYTLAEQDAHLALGVGKNMARSIRFWLQAARIVEEVNVGRSPIGLPTVFGQALLDEDTGFDPYLEDINTWWLLHWMMLSPGGFLPVWWATFHTFSAVQFDPDRLLDHVVAEIGATSAWTSSRTPSESTVRKDVLALLRMYAGTRATSKRESVDDIVDAPFVPLSLLSVSSEPKLYRFGLGPKPGLSGSVAAFTCLDFLSRTGFTGRQALVSTLAVEQGGPGRAFKLGEQDLVELLEKAAANSPDLIALTSVGGSPALVASGQGTLGHLGARILHRHYSARGSAAAEPPDALLPWSAEVESNESRKLLRDEKVTWT